MKGLITSARLWLIKLIVGKNIGVVMNMNILNSLHIDPIPNQPLLVVNNTVRSHDEDNVDELGH